MLMQMKSADPEQQRAIAYVAVWPVLLGRALPAGLFLNRAVFMLL